METKKWWKSKTIWMNLISGLLEGTQLLTGTQIIPAGVLTIIVNVLNIVLRHISDVPLVNKVKQIDI